MSVLPRDVLEDSSLADLHHIASEVGIDGFRRLRKEDLVTSILERQGGDAAASPASDEDAPRPRARRSPRSAAADGDGAPRSRRSAGSDDDDAPAAPRARSRRAASDDDDAPAAPRARSRRAAGDDDDAPAAPRARSRRAASDDDDAPAAPRARSRRAAGDDDDAPAAPRARSRRVASDDDDAPVASRSRSRRGSGGDDEPRAPRSRRSAGDDDDRPRREERDGPEQTVEGTVEVLANGSGFVRLNAPATSDDDAYISAAQVRRCELVSGDRVSGPVRPPRRSERFPSMIRVETINGGAADEVAVGTPFDELPASFPSEAFALNAKDATLKQIADLAPIGRGSRVVVHGAPGSGRSTTLRLLAGELAGVPELELQVVLTGARPEELAEWRAAGTEPAAAVLLGQSPEAQAQALERAIDAGRRTAARGGHAVVVVDALDHLAIGASRRALSAARNLDGGGSLTVIAAAIAPLGGETTRIALDALGALAERRPVLDPQASGTHRVEALVGARKATTVAKARAKAPATDA